MSWKAAKESKPTTHSGDLSRLPQALLPLTGEKRWVNWGWELRQDKRGEQKWTKPPRQPANLRDARSNDPQTWSDYEHAVRRWHDGDADGIGYMLLDARIGAVDLDRCCKRNAETRKVCVEQWARELRAEANGAYCETTVSGTGQRLIGTAQRANLQRRFNRHGGGIELFRNTARYITISGLQLGKCPQLPPIDDFLDTLRARYDANRGQPHNRQDQHQQQTWSATDYEHLIRHGAEEGQRSEAFHGVVWHLASKGWSIERITDELARYPNGIGAKYADRLHEEVTRSYAKWQQRNPTRSLPTIQVVEGQIARVVDETQDCLLAAELNILVRGGMLVEARKRDREAADGRKTTAMLLVPVTQERMSYLLNKYTVQFVRHDGRDWRVINPPAAVVKTLLVLGEWRFPEVIGVVGTPTLRPDGSILSQRGYDAATRLWCDSTIELPTIPERPTRQQAEAALQLYTDLLEGFPFVAPVDRVVALAAILTTVLRGGYALAPMFLVVAHDVGTGKSYLVDLISTLITGRWCPVISPGKDSEEMEKRLGAILLEGGAIVSLDNLSFDLESDLLCQILTQPTVKIRILGQSAVPECEWRGTLFATGNNVRAVGDLVRRTLTCNLDARCERPELRQFSFDPIARVLENRAAYIAAAITVARAYRMSGEPVERPPLGGYEAWSRTVREALIWLGEEDPIKSMDAARVADPERAAAQELIARWRKVIGVGKAVSVQQIIAIANATKDGSSLHRYRHFRAFLIEHVGTARKDEINRQRLGRWLQQQHGRVYDGMRIDVIPHKGKANDYVLSGVGG